MPVRIGLTGGRGTAADTAIPDDKPTRDFYEAVRAAGGEPWVLPALPPGEAAGWLDRLDAVLFTGGADLAPRAYGEAPHPQLGPLEPDRDAFELALFRHAWSRPGMPILGVCRGMQLMNVALGGTLFQDLPSQRPGEIVHARRDRIDAHVHGLRLATDSRLAGILGAPGGVNSLHHQAVKTLAPGLRAVGWAPDGVLEAVEAEGETFRLAVQWHPEILAPTEAASQALFTAFVAAAKAVARRRARPDPPQARS